jgi:hypothetical protein
MNGFKALGYGCLAVASMFLIYALHQGFVAADFYLNLMTTNGLTVESADYWYHFMYVFTPISLQAIAFYSLGGIGVYYGWRQQKILKKQTLSPQPENIKTELSVEASFAYCPFCGKELPKGNYPLCPFCGKSFGVFHN